MLAPTQSDSTSRMDSYCQKPSEPSRKWRVECNDPFVQKLAYTGEEAIHVFNLLSERLPTYQYPNARIELIAPSGQVQGVRFAHGERQ